jgi:hypothetical protein
LIGVGPWLHASNYFQVRLDVRAPMTHLTSQLPSHEQALAARVFRLNRHTIAARVFNRNHHAIDQAFATKVFHLNHHATEQALAPRVLRLNRHHLVPGIFHRISMSTAKLLHLIATALLSD